MDAEKNRRNLRKVRGLVKYGTAVITMMGAVHCALLFGGFDHVYIHLLWCGFALMLGVYLNRLFGFCKTHLVCVGYITLMLVLMSVEHRVPWAENQIVTGVLAVIGFILFLLLLWKAKKSC